MNELEAQTLEIGRAIFSRVRAHQPHWFSRAWFDDAAMAWSMRDEALKVQMFRFVDALPGLRTNDSICRHIGEYLSPVTDRLPAVARFAINRVDRGGLLAACAPSLARFATRQLARRFIAGADTREVVAAIERLRRSRMAFTIDLLGEAILSETEAEGYQASYLKMIAGLADASRRWQSVPQIDIADHGPLPPVNISVKLSALSSRADPIDPAGSSKAVRERLRPILRLAKERGVFVNVDMESHAFKDLTLRIFKDALSEDEFRAWPDVGIAMQAYLTKTEDDMCDLARWAEKRGAPVWVRLVKGAYWDYETVIAAQNQWSPPVFTDKNATDANYERITDFLLERRAVLRPALGTHNVRSMAHAIARARRMNLPANAYEIQMLYGMADPLKDALVELGQRVRIYTPFGQLLPGMAYLVRRLLENTSNHGFVRAEFLDHVSEEQLLMDPASKPARPAPMPPAKAFTNEAPADFSRADVREAMAKAIAAVPVNESVPLVIDGVAVSTAKTIDSVDPSRRSRVLGKVASAGVTEAERAVRAAKSAYPGWRDRGAASRAALIDRTADMLARDRFALSALIVAESGKAWREADADVVEAIDFCRYYASEMRRLDQPLLRNIPGELNSYFYEPRGVAVVIAPWNFPLAILCGMATAALVAGNTVIMKPAEQTPVIAARLMRAFMDAGLPIGAVNFLPGVGEEIGPFLVDHPDVSLVAFTGSRDVGLAINRSAALTKPDASEVKRVIAEMGGKNAIIIDDDADLDEAVQGVMWSAFGYQGQKCSACSRAIVLPGVHDDFLKRLLAATASLSIGPADDPGNAIGPLIDAEAQARVLDRIAKGKGEARLAYAGTVDADLAQEGCYVAPHIFVDVPPQSTLAQEEIFGPVLAVIRAKDLDDALAIANGTRYALTGGCYSRSPRTIERIRREFRVGNVYINRKITGAIVDRQPFGGFKLSGIGSKAGGPDYLLQFLLPRAVTENTLRHGFSPEVAS